MPRSYICQDELGAFLRSRRESASREALALPPRRGRSVGLRREEVAFLSGVSVTWYTWLEQGRDIQPSREVLESIANAMHFSLAERGFLLELCGYKRTPMGGTYDEVPFSVRQLISALPGIPCFAITSSWDIVAWNPAYAKLYPKISTLGASDRNLLWLVFTDPYVRQLLPDWEQECRTFVAQFRAESAIVHRGDSSASELIENLRHNSQNFCDTWDSRMIEQFASTDRRFNHPKVGQLDLMHHRLSPADNPDLQIVMYTAVTASAQMRLAQLLQVADDGSIAE